MKHIIAAALLMVASSATAQQCGPSVKMHHILGSQFGEERLSAGLMEGAGHIVEVWVNSETRTFTILLTRPSGISCVSMTGTNWNSYPPTPKGEKM